MSAAAPVPPGGDRVEYDPSSAVPAAEAAPSSAVTDSSAATNEAGVGGGTTDAAGGPPVASDTGLETALHADRLAAALGAPGSGAAEALRSLSGLDATQLREKQQRLEAMVADLDRLERRLAEAEGTTIDLGPYLEGIAEEARPRALRLEVGLATRKVRELKTFLGDFAKLCALLATGRGADIVSQKGLEGAWKEITGYSFEQYQRNLTPLLAPWRDNGNDWLTDFVGHPLFGYGMASYFRDQGYGKLESFVGAVLGDLVWEFALEGAAAPVEWNDLLTTAVIGALAGSVLKDARVGPYEITPTGGIDPRSGRVALGLRLQQKLGENRTLSADITRSGETNIVRGELEIGNVGIYGFAEGRTGERNPDRFGAGFRIRF